MSDEEINIEALDKEIEEELKLAEEQESKMIPQNDENKEIDASNFSYTETINYYGNDDSTEDEVIW